jgi:hypothetical protein
MCCIMQKPQAIRIDHVFNRSTILERSNRCRYRLLNLPSLRLQHESESTKDLGVNSKSCPSQADTATPPGLIGSANQTLHVCLYENITGSTLPQIQSERPLMAKSIDCTWYKTYMTCPAQPLPLSYASIANCSASADDGSKEI